MLDDVDRLVVAFLVDNGYPLSTVWAVYDRCYPIAARLLATDGLVDDVVYPDMPDMDLDLAMMIAEWMQDALQRRER